MVVCGTPVGELDADGAGTAMPPCVRIWLGVPTVVTSPMVFSGAVGLSDSLCSTQSPVTWERLRIPPITRGLGGGGAGSCGGGAKELVDTPSGNMANRYSNPANLKLN